MVMQTSSLESGLRFDNQCVWVTGAAQGIGHQIALQFCELGATVIGLDRAFDAQTDYSFQTETLDISDPQTVKVSAEKLRSQHPCIDVFVNVAGILHLGETESISVEQWQECFNVNTSGPFYLFQQLIPMFKQQGHGSVVTVSSNAAHVPRQNMSAYCASKSALTSLSHCVGLELAPFGVRCNVVSPGSTDTQMQRMLWQTPEAEQKTIAGFPEQYKLGIPLGKIAQSSDIANVVIFLASQLANHITMQDIVVDGGATLNS